MARDDCVPRDSRKLFTNSRFCSQPLHFGSQSPIENYPTSHPTFRLETISFTTTNWSMSVLTTTTTTPLPKRPLETPFSYDGETTVLRTRSWLAEVETFCHHRIDDNTLWPCVAMQYLVGKAATWYAQWNEENEPRPWEEFQIAVEQEFCDDKQQQTFQYPPLEENARPYKRFRGETSLHENRHRKHLSADSYELEQLSSTFNYRDNEHDKSQDPRRHRFYYRTQQDSESPTRLVYSRHDRYKDRANRFSHDEFRRQRRSSDGSPEPLDRSDVFYRFREVLKRRDSEYTWNKPSTPPERDANSETTPAQTSNEPHSTSLDPAQPENSKRHSAPLSQYSRDVEELLATKGCLRCGSPHHSTKRCTCYTLKALTNVERLLLKKLGICFRCRAGCHYGEQCHLAVTPPEIATILETLDCFRCSANDHSTLHCTTYPPFKKLSDAERKKLSELGLCFTCRVTAHLHGSCPLNPSVTTRYPNMSTGSSCSRCGSNSHNTQNCQTRLELKPLDDEERERCMRLGLCFKCRQKNHAINECPTL